MPDLSAYIELDIDLKLKRALKSLSGFVHSENREERLRYLDEAISLLQDIRSGIKQL